MNLAILYASSVVLFYFIINPRHDILYNKDWWAMTCVFFCCAMTSGQIWNSMRNPPIISFRLFTHTDGQCVLESCIVAIIYIAIFRSITKIIEAANERNNEIKDKEVTSGIILMFVLFGILFVIFRRKAGDDPLAFLF